VPGAFCISDKTISRQHLVVEVGAVGSEDAVCCPELFGESILIVTSEISTLDRHLHCQTLERRLGPRSMVNRSVAKVMSSLVGERP
jgi:hypothetical protein